MLYIGNHTTSSKGYEKMAQQMIANGGNTFAFFTRNPRGGNAKAIDETDVKKFLSLAGDNGFGKMVSRRQGNHNPRILALPEKNSGKKHGIYYHASFYDLQAASQLRKISENLPEILWRTT